jgi:hypothetical protein
MSHLFPHRGSLRSRYRHLPRSAWAALNRLKRAEHFSDYPSDPRPGEPALVRYVEGLDTGRTICDVIIVTDDGQVLRFTEALAPLERVPRAA